MKLLGNKTNYAIVKSCVLNKKLCVICGGVCSGKSVLAEEIVQMLNFKSLYFDASVKRSVKYINETIATFVYANAEKKVVVFDEFEYIIQENVGANTIIDLLKHVQVPVIICIQSNYIKRMYKITGKHSATYVDMCKPSISALVKLCKDEAARQKIKVTQKAIKEKIEIFNTDIRKLLNSLNTNSKVHELCTDCYEVGDILFDCKNTIVHKMSLAQQDLFIIVPIVHENYLNVSRDVPRCASLLGECDKIHTVMYNEGGAMYEHCSLLGAAFVSYYCSKPKTIKYGSVLSKISNIQTKEKTIKKLFEETQVQTIDQLLILSMNNYKVSRNTQQALNKLSI